MSLWYSVDFEAGQKVKVLNKKYCWLYPKSERKKLKQLVPSFDHCKTLYTKCDFKIEACVHEQILVLEDMFKQYSSTLDTEMKLQNTLIDRLWVLSQRHSFLCDSGVCVNLYPEIVAELTNDRILCEFQHKLKALNKSNCRLGASLDKVRAELIELEHRRRQLDMTVESYFIVGNSTQRPLEYMREIIYDLFRYFYGMLCKLKCWAQLIDPGDAGAIEDYVALVKPSADYENFLRIGIKDCTCMKTNNRECICAYTRAC